VRDASRIRDLLFLFAIVCVSSCSRSGATGVARIRLVSPNQAAGSAYVEVSGLSDAQQNALARPTVTLEEWQQVMTVSVRQDAESGRSLPMAGRYAIARDVLRFTPLYPFDPGREYEVRFGSIAATVSLPARPAASPTYVTALYPSGEVVPENQLRMYIHFSAPMGRRGGVDRLKLLDDRGREVEMPFLPLEAEFWNADRTRYTVFFDPGRQKRGILPNREMGPSLMKGRTYTLVVDRSWVDGNGNQLRESFTKRFRVGRPVLSALEPDRWRIEPPKAGTRDPLSVAFPEPLDHALLQDAIGVRHQGQAITGEIRTDGAEKRWIMTPTEAWRPGRYELTVLSILEDVAGNRVGRPFEASEFSQPSEPRVDSIAATLPFTVQP
jgi:hypothetical protein